MSKGKNVSWSDLERNAKKTAGMPVTKNKYTIKILVGLLVSFIVCGIIQVISWISLLF